MRELVLLLAFYGDALRVTMDMSQISSDLSQTKESFESISFPAEENTPTSFITKNEENTPTSFMTKNEENTPTSFITQNEENTPTSFITKNEENTPASFVTKNEENTPASFITRIVLTKKYRPNANQAPIPEESQKSMEQWSQIATNLANAVPNGPIQKSLSENSMHDVQEEVAKGKQGLEDAENATFQVQSQIQQQKQQLRKMPSKKGKGANGKGYSTKNGNEIEAARKNGVKKGKGANGKGHSTKNDKGGKKKGKGR